MLPERYKGDDEDFSYLSGNWYGKDSSFKVEIKGTEITWIGRGTFAGKKWSHKGWGTVYGNTIDADFEDLPESHWAGKKRKVTGTISTNHEEGKLIIEWVGIHVTWERKKSW